MEWRVRRKNGKPAGSGGDRPVIDNDDLNHHSGCGVGGSGWTWEVKMMRFGNWVEGGLRVLVF